MDTRIEDTWEGDTQEGRLAGGQDGLKERELLVRLHNITGKPRQERPCTLPEWSGNKIASRLNMMIHPSSLSNCNTNTSDVSIQFRLRFC